MKTLLHTAVIFSAALIFPKQSHLQVANYAFTETTGVYQAIVGDPTLASTSGTIGVSSSNRVTFSSPFDFCSGGTNFSAGSNFTISHDGWAAFGNPSVTTATSPFPLTNFNNCFSAFGTDLQTTGTSSYGARVEGSSPNRVLVLQWGQSYFGDANQVPFVTTNYWRRVVNGHSNDRLHFQIRLYETTNVIEFCYLISNPRTTSNGSITSDVQVGLRGANASDFNVRRKSSTGSVWNNNTTAGVALPSGTSNTMNFNNVRNDANNKPTFVIPVNPGTSNSTAGKAGPGTGTIFRWTPVPDPMAPIGAVSNCMTVLPVDLTEFTCTKSERINHLIWTTATEQNSDYFIIERSLNGAEWSLVGRSEASGNSSFPLSYSLEDRSFEPTINYYRLTQVDIDGKSNVYKMISVDNRLSKFDLIKTVNMMGQDVGPFYKGLVLEVYSDGTTQKVYR